jgi:hypothetical protein
MPQLQSPASLLSEAVRRLHELSDRTDAGDDHPSPTRPDVRATCPSPGSPPCAYVLGRRSGHWTVDDVVPVSGLLGWRAPRSSWAVVVVASGRAWRPDADPRSLRTSLGPVSGRREEGPGPDPVGLALGVARNGEVVGRLTADGGVHDHNPESGRLLDTLRRNLGLPTPPPPEDTARILAVAWLAAIATAAPRGEDTPRPGRTGSGPTPPGRAMGWPAAVRLHPASRLLMTRGERLSTADLEGVLGVARSTWTWEVLHRAEVSNPSMAPLCPPGTAPWMDAGMYARWVLADVPATGLLWRRARTLLTPVARRRLARWLQQCDISVDICVEQKEC